jgi:hypothetical protein
MTRRFYTSILVLMFMFGGTAHALAQIWLADVHVRSQLTYGTNSVSVRPGDTVVAEGHLTTDEHTTMNVWTASGHSFGLGPNHTSDRITFLTPYSNDIAYGAFRIFDEDGDDDEDGYIRIGIMPRANLTALNPVIRGDGGIEYGYRVGDRSWNPWGHHVTVELFYAHGNTIVGPKIAEHTLLTGANSSGWFVIPASQVPPVPAGADGVLAWIDRQDVIPESDESDNEAYTPLTNLRAIAPTYTATGNIEYGYQVQRAYAVTNQYVTVDLFYATGPTLNDILPNVPPIHESSLNLNPGPEHWFELPLGSYPLPPPEATHLVAVIDRYNAMREGDPGKSDNSASTLCQVAPGYRRSAYFQGVGIYTKVENGKTIYATVVHLQNASLGQLVNSTGYPKMGAWWDMAAKFNTSTRRLKAMINGTEFGPDWWLNPLGSKIEFADGLKVDGMVLDYGAKAANPANERVLFTFGVNTAAIIPYNKSVMDDARYPNLIGAISGTRKTNVSGATRQWGGLRDSAFLGYQGETRFLTVVFLTMPDSMTWVGADFEMESFGVTDQNRAQLDGGGSTTLLVDRSAYCQPHTLTIAGIGLVQRALPHVITIYGGK